MINVRYGFGFAEPSIPRGLAASLPRPPTAERPLYSESADGIDADRGEQNNLATGTKIEAPRRIRALGVVFGDTGKHPRRPFYWHILFRRVGAICL
jgi:hypothetical protein